MTKVTIGLPVFNGEKYLAETIESILNQTYDDFSLIISDDGSTDATEEISRAYAERDSRIRYRRKRANEGGPKNYQDLAHENVSPYFRWDAHDDPLQPKFLETCVDILDHDPTVLVAAPAFQLIDEQGAPLPKAATPGYLIDSAGGRWPEFEDNLDLASKDKVKRFAAVVLNTLVGVEQFGLMRKEVIAKIPSQGNYLGSDKPFLAKVALMGKFWMGDRGNPLLLRRLHPQGFSMAAKSSAYRSRFFGGRSSLKNSVFVEKFCFLFDYCAAILRADLTPSERIACFKIVAKRASGRARLIAAHGANGLFVPNFPASPAPAEPERVRVLAD